MPLPLILGGLGRMGLGIGTSTLGGLGMGIGYGFGVRLGYNAYKPSSSQNINKQVMSLNPIESGNGMGRHTAEQRLGLPLQGQPSIRQEKQKMDSITGSAPVTSIDWVTNKRGDSITRKQKNRMSREEYRTWYHTGKMPKKKLVALFGTKAVWK